MAQPITVTVNGSIQAAPSASTSLVPSLSDTVLLSLNKTYSYKQPGNGSVNSPVSPVALGFGSITKVRFVFLRVIGAALKVVATSPIGTATFNVADVWMWHDPNEGDQFTSITLQGVSDFEYILLGD